MRIKCSTQIFYDIGFDMDITLQFSILHTLDSLVNFTKDP